MARFGQFPLGEKTWAYFDDASLILYDQVATEATRPVRRYADALDLDRRRTPVMITSSSLFQIASDAVSFEFLGPGGTFIRFSADHEVSVRFMDRSSSPLFNSLFNGIYQFLTPLRINGYIFLIQDADERPNPNEVDVRLRRIPYSVSGSAEGNGNFVIEEMARGLTNKLDNYAVDPPFGTSTQQNFISNRRASKIRVLQGGSERVLEFLPFDSRNVPNQLPPFNFQT